jgi:hypothetical protein
VELRVEDKTHVAVKACNLLLHTSTSGTFNKTSERMRAASTQRRGVVEAPDVEDYSNYSQSYEPRSHKERVRRSSEEAEERRGLSEERRAVSVEGRESGHRQHRRSHMESSGSNFSKERRTASIDSTEGVGNFDFDDLQRRHREMQHSQQSRCSSRHMFSKVKIHTTL